MSHYCDIMADRPGKLGHNTGSCSIDTDSAMPIWQQARGVPLSHSETMYKQDMLSRNVISPMKSPWALPIVLVGKKDEFTRYCVN